MAKRYYWLKLKDDFFRDKRIKKLRKIAGGDTFVLIYLKLQLISLQNEGMIEYEGIEDDFAEEMSLMLDEDLDNVEVTINFLKQSGLLVESEIPNEFILPETQSLIGSEGASAERVRRYRERKKELPSGSVKIEEPKEKKTPKNKKDKCPDKIAYTIFSSNYNSSYIFNSKEIKKFEFFEDEDVNQLFIDYLLIRPKFKRPPINSHLAIVKLYNKLKDLDDNVRKQMIENAITKSWKDFYPLNDNQQSNGVKKSNKELEENGVNMI